MAVVTGVNGVCTLPENTTLDLFKWSLSVDREVLDISAWADQTNARQKIGGMYGGSGTFEGFMDDTTPVVLTQIIDENSTGGSFVLRSTTGRQFTFTGIFTNYTFGSEKVGLNTVSGSFDVNGVIGIV